MGQEEEISIENIEYLIEKYMAFLIKNSQQLYRTLYFY